MKLKIINEQLKALHGEVVDVAVNNYGKPIERYWRNRLRDAAIDCCVEAIEEKPKAKKGR